MGKLNNLWSGDYQPLRVVAHLATPIAMLPHDGLPLDGILEFAAFRLGWPPVLQHRIDSPGGKRYLPRKETEPANFVIPVKRFGHKHEPNWYWQASWVEFPKGVEIDRQHWNKRTDFADPQLGEHLTFGGKSEKFNMQNGRFKSYHMPLCLAVTTVAQWYCLGAVDGISRLLSHVSSLGHKRGQGYGEVSRWEVWPAKEDWSCWREGKPMRALPDRGGNFTRRYHGVRPPYWSPTRRHLCVVPER